MDSDSWARLATSSSRGRYNNQSRSDPFHVAVEEIDGGDDESRPEFLCPFCAEDFDIVGLCCHIDEEHTIEAKNGVCPVCAKRVGMDLIGHITMQHASLLKIQRKRRYRRGGSHSTFSIMRKELREGNLHTLLGGSPCLVPSSNIDADPLLSSFFYNPATADEPTSVQARSSAEAGSVLGSSIEDSPERNVRQPPLSDKDQEEKARKCEFVQGLLLSTFLDDGL